MFRAKEDIGLENLTTVQGRIYTQENDVGEMGTSIHSQNFGEFCKPPS